MSFRRQFREASRVVLCGLLAIAVWMLGAQQLRAELIATSAALESAADPARDRVVGFLERADVRAQLEALGVDPAEARARVEGLSETQIAALDARLARLPAGGDFVGVVIAVLVAILLILLVTDLLGYTDVFPFINELPRGEAKTGP
jgi:hypothetical protein